VRASSSCSWYTTLLVASVVVCMADGIDTPACSMVDRMLQKRSRIAYSTMPLDDRDLQHQPVLQQHLARRVLEQEHDERDEDTKNEKP
jgi:hypothetical protein